MEQNEERTLHALYENCFEEPFGEAGFRSLLASPGMWGTFAQCADADAPQPAGFALARCIAGEAEIVSLGVHPACRRRGLATALLADTMRRAVELGAESIFLEVAEDNAAAISLYKSAGFTEIDRRAGYYQRKSNPPIDALIMRYVVKKSVSCWKY